MNDFFFFLALCFVFTHEMDAIQNKEWRILPPTAMLSDRIGYLVFTGIHVPLYVFLFWGLFGNSANGINTSLVFGLDVFFVVHVFLHLLLYRHPKNEFTTAFSWTLILGAGVSGAIDLIIRTNN